jgi:hypothetical protein
MDETATTSLNSYNLRHNYKFPERIVYISSLFFLLNITDKVRKKDTVVNTT